MEHLRIKGGARKQYSINTSDTFTVLNILQEKQWILSPRSSPSPPSFPRVSPRVSPLLPSTPMETAAQAAEDPAAMAAPSRRSTLSRHLVSDFPQWLIACPQPGALQHTNQPSFSCICIFTTSFFQLRSSTCCCPCIFNGLYTSL